MPVYEIIEIGVPEYFRPGQVILESGTVVGATTAYTWTLGYSEHRLKFVLGHRRVLRKMHWRTKPAKNMRRALDTAKPVQKQ